MPNENPKITIANFIARAPADLEIEILAGAAGLQERFIDSVRIQKLGLALAGFAHYIHAGRLQLVGQSEIWYLAQLEKEKRIEAIENLNLDEISCILITKDLEPPADLLVIADEKRLPLLRTSLLSSKAITRISSYLQETLAPQITLHGVLMGMFGIGVLMFGDSGIGKSECALDLIRRGHRLISDDAVVIKRIGDCVEGRAPELIQDYLEIHGIGIINVRELYGVSAISKPKNIELCIELKKWNEFEKIDRLGVTAQEEEILSVKIPKFVLPVSSGRNLSTLVETAVRLHFLRETGHDAARELIEKHSAIVAEEK